MAAKNNSIVGTSLDNTSSGQPQNSEVGTGSGAAQVTPGNPVFVGPPVPGAPIAPAGFVPANKAKVAAFKHPLPTQAAHVRAVAAELTTLDSQRDWASMVGLGGLTPGQLAALLIVVANWSDEASRTQAWSAYVRTERSENWDGALTAMDAFAPLLAVYLQGAPGASESLTATQAFIAARSEVAQRAATTRTAPTVARARATKLTAQATKATATANAEEAAAALRHGTGDATITQRAPSAPTPATLASGTGGVKIT